MLTFKNFSSAALFFGFSLLGLRADEGDPIKLIGRYEIETGTRVGRLVVTCEIPDGAHIYSLEQSSPPGPTKINVAKSDAFECVEKFTAQQEPLVIEHDPVFETRIEQFTGDVNFTAPIKVSAKADLEKLKIGLTITLQVCTDSGCVMIRNKKVDVTFGGYFDPKAEDAAKEQAAAEKSTAHKKN